MGSIGGKTKQIVCIVCGDIFEGSLYANAKVAKCQKCKKVKAKVSKPLVQDAAMDAIKENIAVMAPQEVKPVKLMLVRNRQDIEGHVVLDTGEIIERIPAEWQPVQNSLDYLSVSKINAYTDCPAKFNRQYMNVDDPSVDNGNIYTWFGSILHEVMDIAEKFYSDHGVVLDPVQLFDDAWKKRQLTSFSMYKEGRDLIQDFFAKYPIESKPYKTIATEVEWRGKLVDLVGDVIPDDVMHLIKDMDFGAQIDYIGEIDAETAIMKDYKSNRVPYTPGDLADSLQLQAYELIARKLFPQYKRWITGYELFRFGWQQCPPRTEEDLQATKSYIVNVAVQIVRDEVWHEKLNSWCGYCGGRTSCGKYTDLVENPDKHLETIQTDMTDLSSIERDREKLTTALKLLESRKDELAGIMKTAIQGATMNGESVVIDGHELYLQAQSRPTYNYYSVKQVALVHGVSDELDKCLTINKTKLDKLIKSNPHLALEMGRCMEQGYSAPYLMKKKFKGK